jgi:hypothetical protein
LKKGKGFGLLGRPIDSWFFGLPGVSNQSGQDIDDKIDRATVAGMLNLGLVLQLVIDRLDDVAFAQQELVNQQGYRIKIG